ncbi:MAG: hypothetical protein CBD42_003970 [Gammaproteobacteria bacterium TMED182]|nr:hypothetical protein [Gammaproteobacteria bacterium]RPG54391.1 MAG: hypothetical protein CBD42_003970 [Gammaproteobacteria bacterium TMED182]
MTTDQAWIETAFDCAAVDNLNFNVDVYQTFYRAEPSVASLMAHIDELVQNKMLSEVIRLLLNPNIESEEAGYLNFEVKTHIQGYGVSPLMFLSFNRAVYEVLQSSAARVWEDDLAVAVTRRFAVLSDALTEALT